MVGRRVLMKLQLSLVLLAIFVFGNATSDLCNCPNTPEITYCCNRNYYCGLSEDYCGWPNCVEGPCESPPDPNDFPIEEYVTEEFFDSLFNKSMENCTGHTFYTRDAFIKAAYIQTLFARNGTYDDSKLALAAFFAIALNPRLTHDFCYVRSQPDTTTMCYPNVEKLYPCVEEEEYYGRGPLQLTCCSKYYEAGESIGLDLLRYPSIVEEDPVVSFAASMWFWVNIAAAHFDNFGHATRAVDIGLCAGSDDPDDEIAIQYFLKFCNQFDVDPTLKYPYHC